MLPTSEDRDKLVDFVEKTKVMKALVVYRKNHYIKLMPYTREYDEASFDDEENARTMS